MGQVHCPPVNDGPHLYSQLKAGHEDVEQAVSSSAPSSQSFFPSHNCDFAIHFGALFGPPLGHKNLLSGHAIAVQFASSLSSAQS